MKQINKQREVKNSILNAVKTKRRKSNRSIAESAIGRLVAMSVGSVSLHNYKKLESKYCWKSGFRELNLNYQSARQLKLLDKSRNRKYFSLLRKLGETQIIESKNTGKKKKRSFVMRYGKPFSYYYQVLERKND